MQIDVFKYLKELGFGSSDKPDREELKTRWRELCKEHHPDKGGKPKEFQKVMHAYKMLTDPSYQREESESQRGMKGDLTLRVQVPISFEDAFFGRRVVVSYNRVELTPEYKPLVKENHELVTMAVEIPAGSCDGFEYAAPGMGLRCGEEIGDAAVSFKAVQHPKFRLRGANVVSSERVPLDKMLKGGTIEVMTMYGMKTVALPPGCQPNQQISIPNCGVMKVADHIVQLEPIYPTPDDLKQDVWKKLDIDWGATAKEENKDADFEKLFASLRSQSIYGINVGINSGIKIEEEEEEGL